MSAVLIVLLQVCSVWCWPPPPPLSAREAAVLACFQDEPWVDPDGVWLRKCLARVE